MASEGRQQSPIDISDVVVREPQDIDFHYPVTNAVMVNNGHSIELDFEDGAYFVLDGERYDLIQFHFHSPSEHTINHEYFDMEVHFVHENDQGRLAVVGVMYVEGEHNPAIDDIWEKLPAKPGDRVVVHNVFARADETLPTSDRHYRYEGSLTTPPCTEGVLWIVMEEFVEISREQIERFQEFYVGNNRPVQPLYGREVISE
jgi:carbonic anhydrase